MEWCAPRRAGKGSDEIITSWNPTDWWSQQHDLEKKSLTVQDQVPTSTENLKNRDDEAEQIFTVQQSIREQNKVPFEKIEGKEGNMIMKNGLLTVEVSCTATDEFASTQFIRLLAQGFHGKTSLNIEMRNFQSKRRNKSKNLAYFNLI